MAKNEKNKKDKRHFFKDFKAELKRVVWPSKKQLVNNTTAVITIVLIFALIVITLDLVFEKLNEFRIDKLAEVIESTNTTEENNTVDDSSSDVEGEDTNSSEEQNTSENNQDSSQSNEQ